MKTICRKQEVHTLFGLVWMAETVVKYIIFCLENPGKYKGTVDKICKIEK